MHIDPISQAPRVFIGNAISQLALAPAQLLEAVRFDLAYQRSDDLFDNPMAPWFHLITAQGHFPTGLLPNVLRLCAKYGCPAEVKDARERPLDELPLQQLVGALEKEGSALRPYQSELAHKALEKARGVIVAPPRSGKTLTLTAAFDMNPLPAVWLAPTRALVKQTHRVLTRCLRGVEIVSLLGGGSILEKARARMNAHKAQMVVTTPHTAIKLDQRFWSSRAMMIVDEMHHATLVGEGDKPSMFEQINFLAKDVHYRIGATGTHFRSDPATKILMDAFLSEVIGEIQVSDLIAAGYLVPADVLFIPIEAPRVFASDLEEAYRFGVVHHETRNAWIVWAARALTAAKRKVIVLVKLKAHGEKLQGLMPEATYVNGEDGDAVDAGIIAFNEGRIPILIGTSVLGEGIDLPRADALVYAKGGKASVTVTQDIYRVLTAVDGKTKGIVIDFADRTAVQLMRHSIARSKLYARFEDFNVDVLTTATLGTMEERFRL